MTNPTSSPTSEPATLPETSVDEPALRTIPSETLLQGQHEVLITHGSEVYRLRLTRNGKLILQK